MPPALDSIMRNAACIVTMLLFYMLSIAENTTETRRARRWGVDPGRLCEDRLYKQMYRWREDDIKWKTHVGMTYEVPLL